MLGLWTLPAAADELALRPEDDRSGAPLPEGSLRRLGQTAYRLPSACEDLVWAAGALHASTPSGVVTVGPDGGVSLEYAHWGLGIAASADGTMLARGLDHGDVEVIDLRTGRVTRRDGPGGEVLDVTWLPDGRLLAAADLEHPVPEPGVVCERYESRLLLSVWGKRRRPTSQLDLPGCIDARLASWGSDAAVVCPWGALFRLDGGAGSPTLVPGLARPRDLWSSPDGQTLIVALGEGFEIWRDAGVERGQRYLSSAAAMGEQAALGGERWLEIRGQETHTLELADGWVTGLAWRADRQALAACVGHRVGWWDTATGEPLTPWSGHAGPVTAATLSSDGHIAVSGSRFGDVIVWDVPSGQQRARLLLPEVVAVDEVSWSGGVASARAGEQWFRWSIDADWAPASPTSYRIVGQADGTLLIFEGR
jgi:WD40 repeat protein